MRATVVARTGRGGRPGGVGGGRGPTGAGRTTVGARRHGVLARRRHRRGASAPGALGGPADKAMFAALRGVADVVLVGAGTAARRVLRPRAAVTGGPIAPPRAWPARGAAAGRRHPVARPRPGRRRCSRRPSARRSWSRAHPRTPIGRRRSRAVPSWWSRAMTPSTSARPSACSARAAPGWSPARAGRASTATCWRRT